MRFSGLTFLIAFAAVLLLPAAAAADGKVFASVNHTASIPDQQALIHFADGVETLAIETRFTGGGRDFAWVVPLPAVPEVSPATTGLFPTVRAVMDPQVRDTRFLSECVVWLAALALCYIVTRATTGVLQKIMVGVSLVVGCILLLLPAAGITRGGGDAPGGVTVHDRRIVGSYETAVISGASGDELTAWLKGNGYATPEEARPVIQAYAREGWVFAAARLRRDGDADAAATPHPLVFRFAAKAPVYPLRLTGSGGNPVDIDLYVFGAQRAAADGFSVVRCTRPTYAEPLWLFQPIGPGSGARISHTGLRDLAADAVVATKLHGRLSPSQMQNDATIRWEEFRESGARIWSREGAATIAVISALVLLVGGLAAADVTRLINRTRRRSGIGQVSVLAASAMCIGTLVYLALPRTAVTFGRSPYRITGQLQDAALALEWACWDARREDTSKLTAEWAREQIRKDLDRYGERKEREEDSPGNYTISRTAAGFDLRVFDHAGREYRYDIDLTPENGKQDDR